MTLKSFSAGEKIVAADFNNNFSVLESNVATLNSFFDGLSPIPVGFIAMWSGSLNAVPEKWQICDGADGTPDLSGMFIVGAGGNYASADTGGAVSVALQENELPAHFHASDFSVEETGSHTHTYSGLNNRRDGTRHSTRVQTRRRGSSTSATMGASGAHSHSIGGSLGVFGSGEPHENLPPYYALAYIQKVS